MARPARDLHPGAWWLWAIGLATAASTTTNPLLCLVIVGVAGCTVTLRRSDHTWSRSFGLYLCFGAVIVAVRVLFRVLLGGGYGGHQLVWLPTIPLPHWVLGIRLLGPVTRESVLFGLDDGLRLATIVICVGAANALANPKRLLKTLPPALYEIGTACVVAISVLPQLADSLRRVRAARQLRGVPGGRIARMRGVVVPVLEDALERSMALAASMDVRGYGRTGEQSRGERWLSGLLMVLSLLGICLGAFVTLDQSGSVDPALGRILLAAGVVVAVGAMWLAGRRVRRTRYRPDRWRLAETVVAVSGVVSGAGLVQLAGEQPAVLTPALDVLPPVSAAALLLALVGLVAGVVAPPPMLGGATGLPARSARPTREKGVSGARAA